jgi:hypothetical protein
MSVEFMAFIGVLVVVPSALAIWIAVRQGKENHHQ